MSQYKLSTSDIEINPQHLLFLFLAAGPWRTKTFFGHVSPDRFKLRDCGLVTIQMRFLVLIRSQNAFLGQQPDPKTRF